MEASERDRTRDGNRIVSDAPKLLPPLIAGWIINFGYRNLVSKVLSTTVQKHSGKCLASNSLQFLRARTLAKNCVFPLGLVIAGENILLKDQVSDLKGKVAQLNRQQDSDAAAISLPAAVAPDASGKFNILNWIIPFMVIGLAVGIYTFVMEEYRGVDGSELSDS